jgi:hypothetical protein
MTDTRLTCHCGAWELALSAPPTEVGRCNCSFCLKHGLSLAHVMAPDLTILRVGEETIYAPKDRNRHHFCATCCCHLFTETPDWDTADSQALTRRSVNLALMVDVERFESLPEYRLDGRSGWG